MVCLNVILCYRMTCLWFCNKKGALFVPDPVLLMHPAVRKPESPYIRQGLYSPWTLLPSPAGCSPLTRACNVLKYTVFIRAVKRLNKLAGSPRTETSTHTLFLGSTAGRLWRDMHCHCSLTWLFSRCSATDSTLPTAWTKGHLFQKDLLSPSNQEQIFPQFLPELFWRGNKMMMEA